MESQTAEGSGLWAGVEGRFQPDSTTMFLEDRAIASRLPIFGGLAAGLNAVAMSLVAFGFDEISAGWLAVATAAVYLLATLYYIGTGRLAVFLVVILWASLLNNIAAHVLLGGFAWSGTNLAWGVLITATSALFLSKRHTAVLGGTYLIAAFVLAFLESSLQASRPQPAVQVTTIFALDMFVASLIILIPTTAFLVTQMGSEQERANSLLLNVLPEPIAARLKKTPGVIADSFDDCTVLFADLVGFTAYSAKVSPEQLVTELSLIFSRFDSLVARRGVEKIKTVGDGYLVIAGAPLPRADHVEMMCHLALDMQETMLSINDEFGLGFQLRIGMNTGPVVAGVIGETRLSYDLWGDTVNLASRMQTRGEPGTVQTTESVYLTARDRFDFVSAGSIELKEREIPAYRLVAETS